jgi:hypothetical protein
VDRHRYLEKLRISKPLLFSQLCKRHGLGTPPILPSTSPQPTVAVELPLDFNNETPGSMSSNRRNGRGQNRRGGKQIMPLYPRLLSVPPVPPALPVQPPSKHRVSPKLQTRRVTFCTIVLFQILRNAAELVRLFLYSIARSRFRVLMTPTNLCYVVNAAEKKRTVPGKK